MNNIYLKNGMLLAVLSIIMTLALYFIDPAMIFGVVGYLGLLLPIIFMIKSAIEEKRGNNGYLSFGEGLKVTFLTAAIGLFFSSIFSFVLMTIIDPGMLEIAQEQAVAGAESIVDMVGGDESMREEMLDNIEEEDLTPTFTMTLFNYLVMLIPYFFLCLIISAIIKKEDKSFA